MGADLLRVSEPSEGGEMKRALVLIIGVLVTSSIYIAEKGEVLTFHAYVDSDICARLMFGPITTSRSECSLKTYKDGSNPVLVRLSDNTVFSVNKTKMLKDYVGGFAEANGEVKSKSGTMKLETIKMEDRNNIPAGAANPLLDVRTYKTGGSAETHEKVRHELAMIPYITNFDFISFTMVGQDVILSGWTVRDTNRSDAEYRASKVPGVTKVINNIEILPLGGADMEIRAAARAALQRNLSTYFWSNGSDIKIIVKNSTIILLGSVRTKEDSDIATIQCNSVPLAFHVFNLLRVEPPAPKKKG